MLRRTGFFSADVQGISGSKYFPAVKEAEYKTARKYAELVFKEYNPQIREDVILKTKQYGSKKIKEVFSIVAKKNIDNPKRKYSYVVGVLENWGSNQILAGNLIFNLLLTQCLPI